MSCNFQILWIIQQNCFTTIWIISTILMSTTTEKTVGEIIYRVDPLALLSATLRTYQKAVCDTEQVILTCPRGTSISIEVAQYSKQDDGISIDELCPLDDKTLDNLSTKQIQLGQNNSDFRNSSNNENSNNIPTDIIPENCMWPNALQYSLLQTVVEACQKKKHCKFNATPGTYGVGSSGVGDNTGSSSYHYTNIEADPCPRVRKFVEIAYKCRPYEFRSKLSCENDIIQLECNPYSRIAIYSASFGRTEYESIQCPQPQGVREETCLASYATETVMQICHGRRRCNLAADANTFGSPCHRNSRMYLKVVYTCVPKKVLKDRYESISETDEREDFDGDINDLYEDDQFFKESEAIPKLQSNLTNTSTVLINDKNINIGNGTNPIINLESILSSPNPVMTHTQEINSIGDREHVYFFLLLAGTCFFLLCIIIVAVRLIIQKKNNHVMSQEQNNSTSSAKGETSIPNGFDDNISEIDADIDLTVQQIHVPSVSKNENYITYGPTSSLYSRLGPSNISQTSSTILSAQNSLICSKQSPDIIGATNKYIHSSGIIGQKSHTNNGMDTIIGCHKSSMSQYTKASTPSSNNTFNELPLGRSESSFIQQATVTNTQSPKQNQHQQQQQQPHSIVVLQCTGPQHETFHYDGTAPRTLSTGVAHNSQFYYG